MLDVVVKPEYTIVCFTAIQVVVLKFLDSTVIAGVVPPSVAVLVVICMIRSLRQTQKALLGIE